MKTVLLLSKDYENMIAFSLAITGEYQKSVRPSAVKILTYEDGSIGAYFGREDIREVPVSESPKKHFYASTNENAEEQIKELNDVMNNTFEGMRVSKPFITANGNNTVVFVVGEVVETDDDDDDYDDDDDEAEEE